MMRANHLSAEEIIKYMDTSDMSEEYLFWMEEASEHLLTCNECQRRLRRALTTESICEDGGLEAGLRLLAKEEKSRKKNDKEVCFAFYMADLQKRVGVARGADADNKTDAAYPNAGQPIIPEICGDKLIVRVAKELVWEQIGIVGQRFNVILRPIGKIPIKKEAVWNEAGGYYETEFDIGETGEKFDVYIDII